MCLWYDNHIVQFVPNGKLTTQRTHQVACLYSTAAATQTLATSRMRKQITYVSLIILSNLNIYAQDKLEITLNNIEVYKNFENNTFKITKNDTIIYDKLKFVALAERSLQVLNKKAELFYLNDKLEIVSYPEKVEEFYCGTVDYFWTKVIEKDNYYLIERTTDPIDSREKTKKEIIDTIAKNNIKEIYFLTKEKSLSYDENFFYPETLIIETNDNKIGIRSNNLIEYYDEIDFSNPFAIKVRKNNLWGYRNTELKYKELTKFVYGLASFKLENGEKGFIDRKGNEYLE